MSCVFCLKITFWLQVWLLSFSSYVTQSTSTKHFLKLLIFALIKQHLIFKSHGKSRTVNLFIYFFHFLARIHVLTFQRYYRILSNTKFVLCFFSQYCSLFGRRQFWSPYNSSLCISWSCCPSTLIFIVTSNLCM